MEHYQGHRKRLRDRFIASNGGGLADYEILELLLMYTVPRKDVRPVAKGLLAHYGTLKDVLDADPKELANVPGLGGNTASFILLMRTLMRRYFELAGNRSDILNSPETVVSFCRAALEAEKNEVFLTLFVSSKNRLIRSERIAEGTIDQAAVYPRKVIEKALAANAAALIFVHNHPSGDPAPSAEDIALTRTLSRAAEAVGLTVHDHIVIGNGRHFSFRAAGMLEG